MRTSCSFWVLIAALLLSACGASPTPEAPILTAPAIGVQITKQYCPSIEVQVGTSIAWTNADTVDHIVIIERMDEQGVVVDSGGTDLLQPGNTFSILLTEAGQYTYYCSLDRKQFGTIHILPDTPVGGDASQESSTASAGTPQCIETMIPATIAEVQPAQPSAGSEITVTGSGGFVQDSCGGVNESARSFTLYLDREPVGDFICYVNHCELKFRLPDPLTEGSHCLSTQKDVCEFEFSVIKQ
jgi:plastocyanin